jgi:hypothetical protein
MSGYGLGPDGSGRSGSSRTSRTVGNDGTVT